MNDFSVVGLLGRLVLSLAVVLGLMLLAATVVRRRGNVLGSKGGFAVVARQQLGRSASLQVVTIGDRALVLGVTEQSVTLIAEADVELFPSRRDGNEGTTTTTTTTTTKALHPHDPTGAHRTVLPARGDTASAPARKGSFDQLRERVARR